MVYRSFLPEQANRVIDYCENRGIDYDLSFNDFLSNDSEIEIGLSPRDWQRIERHGL